MTNPVTRGFNRITKAIAGRSRHDREMEYLNGSMSLTDLERRQRNIDRGMFRDY